MPSRTGVELGVERLDAVFDNVHVAEVLDRRVERDAGGAVRRMVSSSSVMTDIIRPVGSAVITRFERSAASIRGVHQTRGRFNRPCQSVRSQACSAHSPEPGDDSGSSGAIVVGGSRGNRQRVTDGVHDHRSAREPRGWILTANTNAAYGTTVPGLRRGESTVGSARPTHRAEVGHVAEREVVEDADASWSPTC